MPLAIKPSEAPQQNIMNIFHRQKHFGEVGNQATIYSKYDITKKDMMKVADLVEEISGLKVDEKAKNGDLPPLITRAAAEKLEKEYLKSLGLGLRARLLPGRIGESDGYYHIPTGTPYLIVDNIEKHLGRYEKEIKKGSADLAEQKEVVRQVARFYILDGIAHELAHQTFIKNSPAIKEDISRMREYATETATPLLLQVVPSIRKNREKISSRIDALDMIIEGVAYHVASQTMERLGFYDWADQEREAVKKERKIMKGVDFLLKIKETTGKNPVQLVAEHPPISKEEMEKPREYLERVKT